MSGQSAIIPNLLFDENNSFQKELHRKVDAYLGESGRSSRDNPAMYLKSFIILSLFASAYVLLVFLAQEPWQAIALSVVLGLAVTGIGFSIQHDAGHNAYSRHHWINRAMAMTMDMIGGSSYVWRWKHVVFHHRFVNITGYDPDIDLGGLGRLSPHKKPKAVFKLQHIYIWILYGFLVLKWHLFDDFKALMAGRIAGHAIPRPTGWELVVFIAGKAVFFSLAFVIPLFFRPPIPVFLCYGIVAVEAGILMSLIFQLPHCVVGSEFPLPREDTGRMENPWAIHQATVTLNFERNNRILTWLLGGLNFHKEHHLFPVICHVNYPSISHIVQETCAEFGIEYKEHASFWAALASHGRWLYRMGRPESSP